MIENYKGNNGLALEVRSNSKRRIVDAYQMFYCKFRVCIPDQII